MNTKHLLTKSDIIELIKGEELTMSNNNKVKSTFKIEDREVIQDIIIILNTHSKVNE